MTSDSLEERVKSIRFTEFSIPPKTRSGISHVPSGWYERMKSEVSSFATVLIDNPQIYSLSSLDYSPFVSWVMASPHFRKLELWENKKILRGSIMRDQEDRQNKLLKDPSLNTLHPYSKVRHFKEGYLKLFLAPAEAKKSAIIKLKPKIATPHLDPIMLEIDLLYCPRQSYELFNLSNAHNSVYGFSRGYMTIEKLIINPKNQNDVSQNP